MSRLPLAVLLTALTLPLGAQTEPDLIISDIQDAQTWGTAAGMTAFSIGTTACNVGTTALGWNPSTNAHPVILQSLYRLKYGRFQQIGSSWVTHCNAAANQAGCGPCVAAGTGTTLNVGCSDQVSAVQNGNQSALGPRGEVNPVTGLFPFPVAGSYPAPGAIIDRRLQAPYNAVEPAANAGALYFVEAQYIHPDDASSGNANNNASYRAVSIAPGTLQLTFAGSTQPMKSALQAWKDVDPLVQLATVDVPGDGRFIVARKVSNSLKQQLQPEFQYEYAIENLSSERGLGSVSLEFWPGPGPLASTAYVPPTHSGEPFSNALWTMSFAPATATTQGVLTYATTPYATNPNAHALRWGSTMNFSFTCPELVGDLTLNLFKPGTPSSVVVPAFCPPQRPLVAYNVDVQPTSPSDYVDISTTGAPGPIGDDNSFAVPIGFSFPFCGQLYSQVVISTNGYLTFPGENGNVALNTSLPDPGSPNGMIAAYWDDLDCSNLLDIRYQTVSTTAVPTGFAVYWNCRHAGDTQPLRFEILLKPDGKIVTSVLQCPPYPFGGSTATRGIEGQNGEAQLHTFNAVDGSIENHSVRYTKGWSSTNMLYQGRLSGGLLKLFYVSAPGTPILTMVSSDPTPLDLGIDGILPVNPFVAVGISDYFGLLTGVPDPTAVTDTACGAHEWSVVIPPGVFPAGSSLRVAGLDFPSNPSPPTVMNGWFNISNPVLIGY